MNLGEFNQLLDQTYEKMIHMTDSMMTFSMALGGIGALFYAFKHIAFSLANAEPIDIYALRRPFIIGLLISMFPILVIGTIDAVMEPVAHVTEGLIDDQRDKLEDLQERYNLTKDAILVKNKKAYRLSAERYKEVELQINSKTVSLEQAKEAVSEGTSFSISDIVDSFSRKASEMWDDMVYATFSTILLGIMMIISFLSVFFRLILNIIGPLVFAFAIFPGLENGLISWVLRYISIWMWVPIGHILHAFLEVINIRMLEEDLATLTAALNSSENITPTFSSSLMSIFYFFGIAGFIATPTIAGWVVEAGGGVAGLGKALKGATAKAGGLASGLGKGSANATKFGLRRFGGEKINKAMDTGSKVKDILKGNKKR